MSTDDLQQHYDDSLEFINMHKTMSLPELASAMVSMRTEKEMMETELSDINRKYDLLRLNIVPEKMAEEDVTSLTVAGVGRLGVTGDVYAQITDKGVAFEWLNDHGHGDLIQPTVNSSSLKALMRQFMKDGTEYPQEAFKVSPFSRASVTKVK